MRSFERLGCSPTRILTSQSPKGTTVKMGPTHQEEEDNARPLHRETQHRHRRRPGPLKIRPGPLKIFQTYGQPSQPENN